MRHAVKSMTGMPQPVQTQECVYQQNRLVVWNIS